MRPAPILLPWLLLAACGDAPSVAAAAAAEAVAQDPQLLFFDFGTIPHGKAASHDFVLDTRSRGRDYVAVGVHVDCSCARYELRLRNRDGQERVLTGQPFPEFAARPGELLVVHLQIDTATKEAVDLQPMQKSAQLVLQPVGDAQAVEHRLTVPLAFRFGIDAPVRLRPFAALDFEQVPASGSREVLTTLHSDLPDRPVRFGPATCPDPRVQVTVQPDGDGAELRATFTPGQGGLGPFQALVTVATDLPDHYEVHLAATGKVVPDLQATPMDKISLGIFDFARDHPEQFVLVTDHDRRRPPEFVVQKLVDQDGNDCRAWFEVVQTPLAGDPRTIRLTVKWRGPGRPPGFRGQLVLAKDAPTGPILPIELVAFHRDRP